MVLQMPRPDISLDEVIRIIFNEPKPKKLKKLLKKHKSAVIVSFWIVEVCLTTVIKVLRTYYVREKRTCRSCGGEGNVACNKCRNGEVSCDYCNGYGQGRITADIPCPICHTGRTMSCRSCNGRGIQRCSRCGGGGQTTRRVPSGTFYSDEPMHTKGWINTKGLPHDVIEKAKGVTNIKSMQIPQRVSRCIMTKVDRLTEAANEEFKYDDVQPQRYHYRAIPIHVVDFTCKKTPSRIIVGSNHDAYLKKCYS